MTPNRRKTSEQIYDDAQRNHEQRNHSAVSFWECRKAMCILAVKRIRQKQHEEQERSGA